MTGFRLTVPAGLSLGSKALVVNNRGVTNAIASLTAITVATPSTPHATAISPTWAQRNQVNKAFVVTSPYLFGDEVVKVGGVNQIIYARTATTISFYLANAGPTDGAGVLQVTLVGTFGTGNSIGIDVWQAPAITTISPWAGPTDGYTRTIAIYGGPFYADTTVAIATATGLTYQYINGGQIQATFTGGTAGAQIVTVTNKGLFSTTSVFNFIQTPHLTAINQSAATLYSGAVNGQYITLWGTAWDANTVVIDTFTATPYAVPTGNTYVQIPVYNWAAGTHTFVAQKTTGGVTIQSPVGENRSVSIAALPAAPTISNSSNLLLGELLNTNGNVGVQTSVGTITVNNGMQPFAWQFVMTWNGGVSVFKGYPTLDPPYSPANTTGPRFDCMGTYTDTITYGQNKTYETRGYFHVTDAAGRTCQGPEITFRTHFTGLAAPPISAVGIDYALIGITETWIFHGWQGTKPHVTYFGPGDVVVWPAVNVSVVGGVAPYTYTWTRMRDYGNIGTGCDVIGTTPAQFTQYFDKYDIGSTNSTWNCRVTDAAGSSMTSPTVSVTFELWEEFDTEPPSQN